MPDAIFADPRLARIYDAIDAVRSAPEAYAAMAAAFGAVSVLDVGCGTRTLGCAEYTLTRRADRGQGSAGVLQVGVRRRS